MVSVGEKGGIVYLVGKSMSRNHLGQIGVVDSNHSCIWRIEACNIPKNTESVMF